MPIKRILLAALTLIVVLSATACDISPAMQRTAERAVGELIANMPLNAEDIAGALALDYSPIPFVKLKVDVRPISLTKQAVSISLSRFPEIKAMARFEFTGEFSLYANERAIIANRPIDLVGEGAIKVLFRDNRVYIDDIPSIVLKLADRPMECPDIDFIRREPRQVAAGQPYSVSTGVISRSPGHVAFLTFSSNRAVMPDRSALRVSASRQYTYSTTMVTKPATAPDTYYGSITAVEVASRNPGNPLDLNAYDILFSSGLTMIKVQ